MEQALHRQILLGRQSHNDPQRWGCEEHDYGVLNRILIQYRPRSILDCGCGSGRLFKLYVENKVENIVGVDVSAQALVLANQRFPDVPTMHTRLEDLAFPTGRFDIAICNRVLQYVPQHSIADVVGKLCRISHLVYVNELLDAAEENFYMVRHDYVALFTQEGFRLLEEGNLGERPINFMAGRRRLWLGNRTWRRTLSVAQVSLYPEIGCGAP
jgi:SAM-dependent methyltransferase